MYLPYSPPLFSQPSDDTIVSFLQYNVYKVEIQHFSIYWNRIYIAQFDSVAHNESNINEQESIRCEILQEVYHV